MEGNGIKTRGETASEKDKATQRSVISMTNKCLRRKIKEIQHWWEG